MSKTTHGGAREGAGRPVGAGQALIRVAANEEEKATIVANTTPRERAEALLELARERKVRGMSAQKKRITKKLLESGGAWVVRTDKYCGPDDPAEDQINGRRTYHVHPDASCPDGRYVRRFDTLAELENWLENGDSYDE